MLKLILCITLCHQFVKADLIMPRETPAYKMIKPLIIGHRGACGHRPEHTLESYKLAISMGADYVEPDLVSTKDHVLIARHENEIGGTTDVETKFPNRKTTKTIDGNKVTGWFTEDFTLKEIKTLRAKERLDFRDHSFDGKFEIPTFEEVLTLVKAESKRLKKNIGVYPETKHPSYFQSVNLPLEEPLIEMLNKFKLNDAKSLVFIQSFELTNLKKLKKLTPLPLIYLLDDPEIVPYDHVLAKDKRTYLEMLKPENLKEISLTASGIGPYKRYIIPADSSNHSMAPTTLIDDAHAVGLKVHPYTFRSETKYLLTDYNNDPSAEYYEYFKLGVDGLFTDFPDAAVKAWAEYQIKFKKTKTPLKGKHK